MKSANKIKLANLTTWIMLITVSLIALFFIGFVTTTTFDLNVFTSRTSEFIFSFIGFAAVLILCSAILNISLNIGLIADRSIQDLKEKGAGFDTKQFLIIAAAVIFALVAILFAGDYFTRQNEKQKLFAEANDILTRYSASVDKIQTALSDTAKVKQVPEILSFLSNQKEKFPSVHIIVSDEYDGQVVYLKIEQWQDADQLKKPYYGKYFYQCEIQDCEYLEKVFTGKTSESHFWTGENDYRLYFPFDKGKKKFILVFTKYERSGKFGS